MALSNLPTELVLSIGEFLERTEPRAVYRLARVSRRFYSIFRRRLQQIPYEWALPRIDEYKEWIEYGHDLDLPNLEAYEDHFAQFSPRARENVDRAIPISLLCEAVYYGHVSAVRKFLDMGFSPNSYNHLGYRLLNLSIFGLKYSREMMRLLVERNADLSKSDVGESHRTPLCVATAFHNMEAIRDILAINLELLEPTVFYQIAMCCDLETLAYICEKGVNLRMRVPSGDTLLHAAAKNKNRRILEYLLENGILMDLLGCNTFRETPLFIAIRYSYSDHALIMIENGAYVDLENAEGETVLQLAAKMNLPDVIRAILRAALDLNINTQTENGDTALHYAVMRPSFMAKRYGETVKLLLEAGADVHVRNLQGNTPLHLAVMNDFAELEDFRPAWADRETYETCQLLLNAGADRLAMNNAGDMPLQLAREHGFVDAARILQ